MKRLLREDDKAWLYEMHPKVIGTLKDNCEQRRKCYVKQEDGFQGLLSVLPVKNARALVLVDPSYEIKSDYQHVVDVLSKAYQKMPQVMMLLWYPVVNRETIDELERRIDRSPMRNVQLFEVGFSDHSAISCSKRQRLLPSSDKASESFSAADLNLWSTC